MKLTSALLALIACSTAQANLFERTDFILEDRIIALPEASYMQVRDKIKNEEDDLTVSYNETKSEKEAQKLLCERLDDKFERLGLAAANIKYDKAEYDYNTLKQEIEYEIRLMTIASITCNI